jgi:hypothetical protein
MQDDLPAGVPHDDDCRVQLSTVRGAALQLGAVGLLRAPQDRLPPAGLHQLLRLRHRGGLRRLLPLVRAEEREIEDGLLRAPRRGGHGDRPRRHAQRSASAPPRQVPRQRLPRLLHGRLRGAAQRHRQGVEDQERRVPARQPVLLPRPQRRRLVLLRTLHQGPLRHGNHQLRQANLISDSDDMINTTTTAH